MLPLIAFICVLNLYVRENKFSIAKHKIFLFQAFILQQCLNPIPSQYPNFFFGFGFESSQNIRIISDSDPAKTFGLFRIRIHNTAENYHAMLTGWMPLPLPVYNREHFNTIFLSSAPRLFPPFHRDLNIILESIPVVFAIIYDDVYACTAEWRK
jgi:hypothetical protein